MRCNRYDTWEAARNQVLCIVEAPRSVSDPIVTLSHESTGCGDMTAIEQPDGS